MDWMLFGVTLTVMELLILGQWLVAWKRETFFPKQIGKKKTGKKGGIPIICHGGMWTSPILVNPLVAVLVGLYGPTWSWWMWAGTAVIGFVASFFVCKSYLKIPWTETHVEPQITGEGKATAAMYLMYYQMGISTTVFLLLFFFHPYTPLMWVATAVLVPHIVLSTHVVLGIIKPQWYPGRPLRDWWGTWFPITGITVGSLGLTIIRRLLH